MVRIELMEGFNTAMLSKTFLITVLIFLFIGMLFCLSKINSVLKKIKNFSIVDSDKKEYQLYILFIGLILPSIEIIFELYHVRPKSLLINNFIIGILFLILYIASEKSSYIYNRIRSIYTTIFVLYFILVFYNIIFLPQDVVPTYGFIVILFFSFIVLKPVRNYWIFIGIVFLFLSLLYIYELIPIAKTVVLFAYFVMIVLINYIRHMSISEISEKLSFSSEIVNKSSSLTIGANIKGEIKFCSDNIITILGYTPEEVKGLEFWRLTEDPEFIGIDYHKPFVDNRLYVRKLKCKNGEYKFIQWIDKKFSDDLIIGIGQDVSNEIRLRNQYENLIQTANDIIFEVDEKGTFTFVNEFSIKALQYSREELLSKNFSSLIRKDYVTNTMSFYKDRDHIENNFTTLEFPIIKKNGEEMWVSQNVFVKRNNFGTINGYSGIARDITLLKSIQDEKAKRQLKIQKYNKTLKDIAILNHANKENFENTITTILKITTATLGIRRGGYWQYIDDSIRSYTLYDAKIKNIGNHYQFFKSENINYFKKIENKLQVVISDVKLHTTRNKKNDSYIDIHNIFSMLDSPVFIDGELKGVLALEGTDQIKNWDNEDINFAKSISDLIVIALASQMRLEIEQKLAYKSELLLVINENTNQFLLQKSMRILIEGIINEIGRVTNCERISYYKKDSKTNLLNQKCIWTNEKRDFESVDPNWQNLEFSEFDNFINDMTPIEFFMNLKDRIKNEYIKENLNQLNPNSVLFFPVFVKNELDGFFVFNDSIKERIWSNDEISILQLLVKNISASIERNLNESIIEESEERFRLLANNIPGTVFLSNYDDNYSKIYLNDEIEKLTGYPKSDFLENIIFFIDLVVPEDIEYVRRENKIALTEKKSLHIVYKIKHLDGSIVWVEEFGDSIIKNGEIAFMEGILIDITEKKNNEHIIKEKEFAEAANKAKSEFLANMSHEIRTPLNGIIGYTDLLMNSELENFQKTYMETINQSANILMEVVNDILDFSKIESGKLELNIEKHEVAEIIDQIKELINYQANAKKLEIIYIIEEDTPKYIWADYIRLKQILINLLTNAVKFTNTGHIMLLISTVETKRSKAILRFSVKDTGIGIKKSNQKRIFQAFSQEDSSTTKKFGGTGLGLTISNQLLSLMNSSLQINSHYNIGSTFYFDVKFKVSNTASPIKTSLKSREAVIDEPKISFANLKPKILIVEDNKINMLLTKTLLNQIIPSSIIYEAIDGEKAIEKIKNVIPDLILMDIQMPIINGYEATKKIRQLYDTSDGIIIVALTAGTVVGEKEKCIEAGMNDYLSKPIIKKTLREMLEKWLKP